MRESIKKRTNRQDGQWLSIKSYQFPRRCSEQVENNREPLTVGFSRPNRLRLASMLTCFSAVKPVINGPAACGRVGFVFLETVYPDKDFRRERKTHTQKKHTDRD